MTEDELHSTVRELKTGMNTLSSDWSNFLKIEVERRESDAASHRKREESDSTRARVDADRWQKGQTFFGKHGAKLLTFLVVSCSSGLAWYGSQIRGEINSEQRAVKVDEDIGENKKGLKDLKTETATDIGALQEDSVNQTLMMDKGFRRMDKVIVLTGRVKEEDLPDYPPEFKTAVDSAERLKLHSEKFGKKD